MTTPDDENGPAKGDGNPWGKVSADDAAREAEEKGDAFLKPGEVDRLVTEPESKSRAARRAEAKRLQEEAQRKKARDIRMAEIEQRRGIALDPFAEGHATSDPIDEQEKRVASRVHMPRVIEGRDASKTEIPPHAITDDELATFLELLAHKRAWNHAAYAIGRSGAYMRRYAAQDEWFRMACAEALQDFAESIEMETHRRAVVGVEKPIFSQQLGEIIGYERTYSDMLLKVLLEGNNKKYRNNAAVQNIINNDPSTRTGVMVVPGTMAPDQWRQALEERNKPAALAGPVTRPIKPPDSSEE